MSLAFVVEASLTLVLVIFHHFGLFASVLFHYYKTSMLSCITFVMKQIVWGRKCQKAVSKLSAGGINI